MIRTLLLAFLLASPLAVSAQEVNASIIPDDAPAWVDLKTAPEESETSDKPLLVHAYATWCGWCVRADNEVYTDDEVQAYIDSVFVPTRMDIESHEVIDFFDWRLPTSFLASGLGATATPTTIFMRSNGSPITYLSGFREPPEMLVILKWVGEEAYLTESFEAYAERHDATPNSDAERGASPIGGEGTLPDSE